MNLKIANTRANIKKEEELIKELDEEHEKLNVKYPPLSQLQMREDQQLSVIDQLTEKNAYMGDNLENKRQILSNHEV